MSCYLLAVRAVGNLDGGVAVEEDTVAALMIADDERIGEDRRPADIDHDAAIVGGMIERQPAVVAGLRPA